MIGWITFFISFSTIKNQWSESNQKTIKHVRMKNTLTSSSPAKIFHWIQMCLPLLTGQVGIVWPDFGFSILVRLIFLYVLSFVTKTLCFLSKKAEQYLGSFLPFCLVKTNFYTIFKTVSDLKIYKWKNRRLVKEVFKASPKDRVENESP